MCCAKLLQSCQTLCDLIDYSLPGSSVHGDSPGKSPGVGCYTLLQGIFLTQVLNPCLLCLLHWQADSLPLALPGKHMTNKLSYFWPDSLLSSAWQWGRISRFVFYTLKWRSYTVFKNKFSLADLQISSSVQSFSRTNCGHNGARRGWDKMRVAWKHTQYKLP